LKTGQLPVFDEELRDPFGRNPRTPLGQLLPERFNDFLIEQTESLEPIQQFVGEHVIGRNP
jgi:hypothetical protein